MYKTAFHMTRRSTTDSSIRLSTDVTRDAFYIRITIESKWHSRFSIVNIRASVFFLKCLKWDWLAVCVSETYHVPVLNLSRLETKLIFYSCKYYTNTQRYIVIFSSDCFVVWNCYNITSVMWIFHWKLEDNLLFSCDLDRGGFAWKCEHFCLSLQLHT